MPSTQSARALAVTTLPDELARQVTAYLHLEVPALLGWSSAEFLEQVAPLADVTPDQHHGSENAGRLPYVLVLPELPAAAAMPLTREDETAGYVDMNPVEPSVFQPVPSATIPVTPYLTIDVDTGGSTLNVTPDDAGPLLAEQGRLPLTIAEGVAALLLNPGLLRQANAFQMLASRDASKRIPSLWITKTGAPRLGWCWAGNPHSWLGAASCARRAAIPD